MAFEEVLTRPAVLLKDEPKAILPTVLTLATPAILLLLADSFLKAHPSITQPGNILSLIGTAPEALLTRGIAAIIPYLIPFAFTVILGMAITILVMLWYGQIAAQQHDGKKTMLSEALSRPLALFWQAVAANLIALVGVFATFLVFGVIAIGAMLVVSYVFQQAGWGIGILLAIIVGLALVAGAIALVALVAGTMWLLDSIILFTPQRGINAIKMALTLTKQKVFHILGILLVAGVVNYASSYLSQTVMAIPFAGFALSLVISMPFTAWSAMLPAKFFLAYFGRQEPKKR